MELAAVMTEIIGMGSEFNPLHVRRLEAFGVKRGRDEHLAFLHKVEFCLDNADFKSMKRDQLAVHLFLRDADASMARIATEFLQLSIKRPQKSKYNCGSRNFLLRGGRQRGRIYQKLKKKELKALDFA